MAKNFNRKKYRYVKTHARPINNFKMNRNRGRKKWK